MNLKVVFFVAILLLPLGSSTILLGDSLKDVYNIGDLVDVNFSLERSLATQDFLSVNLVCDSDSFVLYKNYIKLNASSKTYFPFEFPAPIEGVCQIEVSFVDEKETSAKFEVSDNLAIDFILNDKSFLPGEILKVNGTVRKQNGDYFEGIILASMPGVITKSFEVNEGSFFIEIPLPVTLPKGEYSITFDVEEKNDLGFVINRGQVLENILVKSKPTSLAIQTIDTFKPAFSSSFNFSLLDQSNNLVENETLIFKIFNPNNDIVYQNEVLSGENISYLFLDNATKGGWKVNSYYGSLSFSRPFYIDENRKIQITNSLGGISVKNIGNVPYEGVVSLSVKNESGEEKILLNLSLGVGDSVTPDFGLEGYYNVSSGDEEFSNVWFTGAAVSMRDSSNITLRSYLISFGFLLLVVACFLGWKYRIKIQKLFEKKKKDYEQDKIKIRKVPAGSVKTAYAIFIKSGLSQNEIINLAKEYRFSYHSLSVSLGYILFSSTSSGINKKIFSFTKSLVRLANDNDKQISIVLNKEVFNDSFSLKDFSLNTRKLMDFSENKILITKDFLLSLGLPIPRTSKNISLAGRETKFYLI